MATNDTTQPDTMDLPSSTSVSHVWKKDFKIQGGMITEGTSNISYTSLLRQIHAGLERGYPENDVIEAVVRIVDPTTPLRHYLDGRSDLSLTSLKDILKAHFKECPITDLYAQLGRLAQENKESAQHFLMRSLELKQKIFVRAKDLGARDESLIQELFISALTTGFKDETIHAGVKRLTENKTADAISDEELMTHLSKLSLEVEERQRKLEKSIKKTATPVYAAHVTPTQNDEITSLRAEVAALKMKKSATPVHVPNDTPPQNEEIASLRAEIAALKMTKTTTPVHVPNDMPMQNGEITSLRAEVAALKKQLKKDEEMPRSNPVMRIPRCCPKCTPAGPRCNHCFKCGGENHISRWCRARPLPGNGRQSLEKGTMQ